jgi:diguanylate cyclase (GGDEF)-like protein
MNVPAVTVIGDIADLIGLRDREALDEALVALVLKAVPCPLRSVTIHRSVGDDKEELWLTCATAQSHAGQPELTSLDPLPVAGHFPQRLQVMSARKPITTPIAGQAGTTVTQTLFPMTEGLDAVGVLQVESEQPLQPQVNELISGLLRVYSNFRGLLDYGERDTLTDLLNRKTFEGSFMRATVSHDTSDTSDGNKRRASVSAHPNWLAMIDIDHFKRVNDNFGHLIGDEVLLLLARLMRTNFRLSDQLYRFGGEEFVVLMQNVSPLDATQVFERLRAITQAHAFPQVGNITVSVGFSALRPGDTPSSAFSRADKAVYYAKAHGRNQSCNFEVLLAQGQLIEADDNIGEIELF